MLKEKQERVVYMNAGLVLDIVIVFLCMCKSEEIQKMQARIKEIKRKENSKEAGAVKMKRILHF